MRRLRRFAAIAGIAVVAIALIVIVLLVFTWPRSALTAIGVRFFLQQRGLHVVRGSFHLAHGVLDVRDLEVKDGAGNDFLTAAHIVVQFEPAGLIGRSERRLGLRSIVIERPVMRLVRLADGSWNVAALASSGPAAAQPPAAAAKPVAPYRFTVRLSDGELQVVDPQALVRFAHAFSVAGLNGRLDLDEGSISTGSVGGELRTEQGNTAVSARLFENDTIAFARVQVTAHGVPLAPIVDGIAPSTAFTVQRGIVDVRGQAYALDYEAGAPQWHLTASGTLRDGRLVVQPLITPLRDMHGALRFYDGWLSTAALEGDIAGEPARATGGMQLLGGVRFAVAAASEGDLQRQRTMLRFSSRLPLRGPSALRVRIDGPVNDLRVRAGIAVRQGSYGPVGLHVADGSLFYNNGHVSLHAADRATAGGNVWADGDIDVQSNPVSVSMILAGEIPSDQMPIVGNLNPHGQTRALATVTGPISGLTTYGYAEFGPRDPRANGIFSAGPQSLVLGPMLLRNGAGEAMIASSVDRGGRPGLRTAELFAHQFPLDVAPGAHVLADLPSFAVRAPAMHGIVSGSAFVGGSPPATAIDASIDRASFAGARLDTIAVRAAGRNGFIHIDSLTVRGSSVRATARGDALLGNDLRPQALAIAGNGSADLSALAQAAPQARMNGDAAGDFSALLDGSAWTVAAQMRSNDARIAGVPIQSADAAASGSSGTAGAVLADIGAAGGHIGAFGTLPSPSGGENADVVAVAQAVDLNALRAAGLPLEGGTATGIAELRGSLSRPQLHAAAVMTSSYRNIPIAGDVDVAYADGTLTTNESRVAVAGTRGTISGAVRGLGSGAPLSSSSFEGRLVVDEGDLGAVDRFITAKAPLGGSVSADLHLAGSLSAPLIDGTLRSDSGTIRGVAFQDLRANVGAVGRRMTLQNGSVQLGRSLFSLSGALAPGEISVRAVSPRVDLADFNDFFGGADVFRGTGAFRVAVDSRPAGGLRAFGGLRLDDAALRGYELGHVETHFSSSQGALLATVSQTGPGGSATLSGIASFQRFNGGLPDFPSASYNVKATVHNLDVDELTPLFGQEDLGLTGTLEGAGTLQGTLRRPTAFARVDLHDGHLRRITINTLSADVRSDLQRVSIDNAVIGLRFVNGTGHGHYDFGSENIGGVLNLDAADLRELTSSFKLPFAMAGRAHATVAISGTRHAPRVQTSVTGDADTVAGIRFNSMTANVSYAPGEVTIGDTQLAPAAGGTLDLRGALPIQLQPLGLGPKQRPISLTLRADKFSLATINPLTHPNADFDGALDAQFSLTGTAGRPALAGTASIGRAEVRSQWETVPLQNASAKLTLAQDTITIHSLSGQLGDGTIKANGAAHIVPAAGLRSNAGLEFYSAVSLHNATINVPNWLSGTFNGDLSLTKEAVRPYLAGNVALSSATVPFSAIMALASGSTSALAAQSAPQTNVPGVPPLRPGHTIVYGGNIYGQFSHTLTSTPNATPTPRSFNLPPVDFNVAVAAGKDVRVRGGSAIDLTAAGSVVLAGSLSNPTLAGSFHAIRGQVGYFDTTFRLQRGTVTFAPNEGLLPTLDAVGVTNVGGTQITVTITGRVDNLNTDFSSDPPMSRDQIVATLLHAPQVGALTTGTQQQAQTAIVQTAQNYFSAELTRNLLFPFESALAQSLNLQQVAFIFDPQGNVAIEVRTNISPTVSALYRSSLTVPVTQSYGVSYNLRDYLALDFYQSQPPFGNAYTTINLRYLFP